MDVITAQKAIQLAHQLKCIDEYLKTINVKINCGNYSQFYLMTGINQHDNEERLTKNIRNQLRKRRNALQKELDEL